VIDDAGIDDLPARRQVEVGVYGPERDTLMRNVAIPRGPGVDIEAPGRRIDAYRIERLAGDAIHDGNDVGVALMPEIVVLVDREQLVLNRAAREAVRKGQSTRGSTAGETDRAYQYLEQAYQERSAWLPLALRNPGFDLLRSDPRFQAIYKKVGLPD